MSRFSIIPNEQTPKVPPMESPRNFVAFNDVMLNSFLNYARNYPNTVGLAANQVEIEGKRIMHRFFAYFNENVGYWQMVIDPVITEYLGWSEEKEEGCKTWAGKRMIAVRHKAVKVNYYDMDGKFHEGEIFTNFVAQVWQHETDHLNGVFQDILEPNDPRQARGFKIPNRNDQCLCGSGLKYKNCCLKYDR